VGSNPTLSAIQSLISLAYAHAPRKAGFGAHNGRRRSGLRVFVSLAEEGRESGSVSPSQRRVIYFGAQNETSSSN
jgi:hypothetical protein